ncbi:LysR family transcriptional regulator [Candidatus Nitrospira nitrificans]|uniref:LysR substrate-binding domain protein n=1 Tax=Candidatus Nitrospira nitrificans TaxID=1742973 RepID=A0A0S4LQ54_9BACT|nr:LysR family transcriptional regulator [Candidatus Nitrospira nitrificans]CUS38736.1 LysR substrate-binding domain protein [Candidatus Nitrospira nitrificans]
MDVGKLKAFIVVAEELNFRRSAEILGMSQPPLTRLIASLEHELDTKLFERTTRRVRLTGAGVLLLREAREIASAISRIESDVRAVGKKTTGVLKIGFSRAAFMARFPAVIDEFQVRFPKITLDLREKTSKEIVKLVKNGCLDVGFVEGVISDPEIESHEVDSENLGVLLHKKHPLSTRKEIQLSDLKDDTIILHHRGEVEEWHDRVARLIKGMSRRPKIYVKGDGECCPILVATGRGVALTIAGSQNIASHHTRFVPIRDMFLPVRVFWKGENENPYLRTFVSFAMEKRSVLSRKTECLVLSKEKGVEPDC